MHFYQKLSVSLSVFCEGITEMQKKIFWYYFFLLLLRLHTEIKGLRIPDLNPQGQLQSEENIVITNNKTNKTNGTQDVPESQKSKNNDELLWVTPEITLTTEAILSDILNKQETKVETTVNKVSTEDSQMVTMTSTKMLPTINHTYNSQLVTSEPEKLEFKMDEEITLSRKSCILEISVDGTHDIKVKIKFEPLYNKSSGKCIISISGYKNSMLGVLITDVDLYQNESEEEILKVIVNNFGMDFVLKQYHKKNEYYPLLLTGTNRVYIVLYYNVLTSYKNYSHFNLEVFTYYNYQKHFYGDNNSHSYSNSITEEDSDHILFTTKTSFF